MSMAGMSRGLWLTIPAHVRAYPGVGEAGTLRDNTVTWGLRLTIPAHVRAYPGPVAQELAGMQL